MHPLWPCPLQETQQAGEGDRQGRQKGIENGAKAAGSDVDLNHIDKDTVLDKVESFQNRVDKMFEDDDESEPAKTADEKPESTQTPEKDEKPEPTKTSKDDTPSA